LIPLLSLGGVVAGPVYYTPRGDIAQPITRFDSPSNSILRVLRALRGEFSLASVPCEPKLEVITHSCLQQAGETTRHRFRFSCA